MNKLLLSFLLLSSLSYSQDTISVYFEFGSAKVAPRFTEELKKNLSRYVPEMLDSIQFIGYADSVGKWEANVRLSMKRAKYTHREIKNLIPEGVTTSMFAKGEGALQNQAINRRVDVIFHLFEETLADSTNVLVNADPRCFEVDFLLLQSSHYLEVQKKNKSYIYIEALVIEDLRKANHYYVREDGIRGKTIQKVHWKLKTTGSLWWKKKRYVCTIPKTSYDRFQIFKLSPAPCNGCKETILTKDTIIRTISKVYPDGFLMNNMQSKVRFFGNGQVKIRVPKEYVNLEDTYFSAYSPYRYTTTRIDWTERKGRRNSAYYFTKMDLMNGRIPFIVRRTLTTECVNKYENGWGGGYNGISCGGMLIPAEIEFQINLQPGVFYHNDTLTAYLALGISHTGLNSYTSFIAGMNSHLGFYSSLAYRYHFFSFPFRALSPGNGWSDNSNLQITTYGRMYAGSQWKTSFNRDYTSFVEGNIHLGLVVVNTKSKAFLPRIYVQGGVGIDLLKRINTSPYPYVEAGATCTLTSFKIRP